MVVNRAMREAAWNVHFVIGSGDYPTHFSGIYQNPDSGSVTFRDVRAELALCFEFPPTLAEPRDNAQNAWNGVAFALVDDATSRTLNPTPPAWVTGDASPPVPFPAPVSTGQQRAIQYHIVQHPASCSLPLGASLADHIAAKCASHLARPSRRHHPAYLPCHEAPTDPRLGVMPFRSKKTPRSNSPTKRRASGSVSPEKTTPDGMPAYDYADAIVPPQTGDIDVDVQKAMRQFRSECLASDNCCAVSGQGKPWCSGILAGPGVQACHIIPQQHYHLYPVSGSTAVDQETDLYSPRRLWDAWQDTWSTKNSLLMLKHFHEYFDLRLFSINPDTFRIRAFVPFDVILALDGKTANVPQNVERGALKHHYDMSCIENMSARQHSMKISSMSRTGTSGTGTPFSAATYLLATPASAAASDQAAPDIVGDPSKSPHDPDGQNSASTDHLTERDDLVKGHSLPLEKRSYYDYNEEYDGEARDRKRGRRFDNYYAERPGMLHNRMTPRSRQLLADIDYELCKLQGC